MKVVSLRLSIIAAIGLTLWNVFSTRKLVILESSNGGKKDQLRKQFIGSENEVLGTVERERERGVSSSAKNRTIGKGEKEVSRVDSSRQEHEEEGDWFNSTLWNAKSAPFESCFYVEDVCHQAHEWFYHPQNADPAKSQSISIEFPSFLGEATGGKPSGAYPSSMNIRRTRYKHPHCHYSSTPNHMILQGHFSGMLGEFYNRIFLHFAHYFHYLTTTLDGTPDPNKEALFLSKTQLYVSLLPTEKKMFLDSHELYLGLFTSSPVLPFTSLFDNPGCRCIKRLFFCGYIPPNKQGYAQPADSLRYKQFQIKKEHRPRIPTGPNSSVSVNQNARNQVLRMGITDNLFMQHKIRQFRYRVIDNQVNHHLALQDKQPINETEWQIVGLAQRSSRRRWINQDQVLRLCRERFKTLKIICIEVNLEKPGMESPMQHLITHGGLDAFFSIHGASLTHALLLPQGAMVVELLPYVLPGLYHGGDWTRHVHEPTAGGLPIQGTDLLHIGYPLYRSSALHLEQSCNGKLDLACFSRHHWASRNFTVHPQGILDVIDKYLVQNLTTCQDYNQAAGDDYVLYNVNCSETANESQKSIHHFYRPQNWIHIKTKSFTNAT